MPAIRLINLDDVTIDLVLADTATFEKHNGVTSGNARVEVVDTAKQFRQYWGYTGENGRWAGYLNVDSETGQIVGNGGFKGPPIDGTVEIGYSTFSGFEGKGYASALAAVLVDLARESGKVKQIIAHTLPEEGPSPRILRKTGLIMVGAFQDPIDGPVWRFSLTL